MSKFKQPSSKAIRRTYYRQKGVSLLEVILGVAVAATIALASIQRYRSYEMDKDIRIVNTSVSALMQAANGYFFYKCTELQQTPAGKTIASPFQDFTDVGLLKTTDRIKNPLGGEFTVGYSADKTTDGKKYVWHVSVKAQFPKYLQNLKGEVGADEATVSGNNVEFTWVMTPSNHYANANQGQSPLADRLSLFDRGQDTRGLVNNAACQVVTKVPGTS